jgi:hypothetical protein
MLKSDATPLHDVLLLIRPLAWLRLLPREEGRAQPLPAPVPLRSPGTPGNALAIRWDVLRGCLLLFETA